MVVEGAWDTHQWDELAEQLRARLRAETSDARSAFRLGNLLHLLGHHDEAVYYFDLAWTQRWPGAVTLNNRAVALAHVGDARAALDGLRQALDFDGRCGPAAYNLAIVLERLTDQGRPPDVVLEVNLALPDTPVAELLEHIYEEGAAGSGWGNGDPLTAPLYLWKDDLASGFGFELGSQNANMESGFEKFRRGEELLAERCWREALNAYDEAVQVYPAVESRVVPRRRRAELELAREFRRLAEERRQKGDFEGAAAAHETFFRYAENLPDHHLASELLVSEIQMLGERLRQHEPSLDWRLLQRLISMVRQRIDNLERRGISEVELEPEEGEPPQAPGRESGTERAGEEECNGRRSPGAAEANGSQDRKVRLETDLRTARLREFLQGLCQDAWRQQLLYLSNLGEFGAAERMLRFSEGQWFSNGEQERWCREVFRAQAENLRAAALEALERSDQEMALDLLGEARSVAMQANEESLAESLDHEIAELVRQIRTPEVLEEIEDLLNQGEDLAVLERTADLLLETPDDARLVSLRDTAIQRLLNRCRVAIRAEAWEPAHSMAQQVLDVSPHHGRARVLAAKARAGWRDSLLGAAENALNAGELVEARTLAGRALEVAPGHAPVMELRRRIEVADSTRDEPAARELEHAMVEFGKARAAADPEAAYAPLLELRRLASGAEFTHEATNWFVSLRLDRCHRELERDRTAETAARLLKDLKPVVDLVPGDPRVAAVFDELRRFQDDYPKRRREIAVGLFEDCKKHLLRGGLIEALEALDEIEELGEPALRDDLERYRSETLERIARRLQRLVRTLESKSEGEGVGQGLEELMEVYGRWRPGEEADLRTRWQERRLGHERNRRAGLEWEELEQEIKGIPDRLTAYERLARGVAENRSRGFEMVEIHRDQIQAHFSRLKRDMGWFQRWKTGRIRVRYGIDEPLVGSGRGVEHGGDGRRGGPQP